MSLVLNNWPRVFFLVLAMSIQQESELNNLRESARCDICTEFYNQPKRLPNCCHVYCLRCIKQHLQFSQSNFPPCPICRKPITTPYADVDKLDPARAEQDIVEFVKKFEKCGFCRLESNPNLKCLQCNLFVCDSCEGCHKKLKPSHAVVSIVSTEASGQESQVITCTKHPGQLMDLFCIKCSQAACVHCKEYTHRNCKINRTDKSRYWPLINKTERSVVYLSDYANELRTCLRRVNVELLACIKFAKEYIANLNEIILAPISCSVLSNRVHLICSEANRLLEISEKTQLKVSSLLKESATDYKVAEGIDGVKQQCLDAFKYRRNFSFRTQPVRFNMSTNIRLMVNCNLRKLKSEWAFCKPYYLGHKHAAPDLRIPSPTADKSSNIENMHIKDKSILPTLVCLFKGNSLNNSEKTVSFRKQVPYDAPRGRGRGYLILQAFGYGRIEYKQMSDLSSVFGTDNILYTNEFLEKTNETKSTTILPSAATFKPSARQYKTTATTIEISAGFADIVTQSSRNDIEFEIYKEEHGIPFIGINFYCFLSRVHCFTPFINIIALPGWFDYLGTRAASTNQLDFPFICIIGNRGIDAGLETVFLFEDGAKKLTHCISVFTNTAKLTGGNLHPGTGNISFDVMKSTTGNFVVYASKSENWLSYHTTLPTKSVPESFPLHFDREDLETEVPKTSMITDLLCSLKSGLYFVQHAKEGTLNIGKLEFMQTGVKEHIIKTVKEENTNISLLKLKPLSMVENIRNEIVVVCSVKDDNTKLIIILTNKEGNEAIEVLDIEYPTLTLSGPENENTPPETAQPRVLDVPDHTTIDHFAEAVIVDLEMDEDGQIMYILETKNRTKYCACTRYIMP